VNGNWDQWRESVLIPNFNFAYHRSEHLAKVRVIAVTCIIVPQVGRKLIVLCNLRPKLNYVVG
jgi:hypothetical protein